MPLVGVAVAEVEHLDAFGEAVANLLGDSARILAAASSMASGTPSRSRHRPTTAGALAGVSRKSDRAEVARSMKRLTASWWVTVSGVATVASSGRLSGGTTMTSSPLSPSGRRLVSRNLRFGQAGAEPLHQVADRGHEVLAVVEHQQCGAVREVIGKRLDPPRPVATVQADCRGHGSTQQLGLGELGEWRHPASVAVAAPVQLGDPERDPRLADSARPDQRDHPGRRKVLTNVGQQRPATHERGVEGGRLDGFTLVAGRPVPVLRT